MLLTKKKFYKIKESKNQTKKKYNKKKRKRKRRNDKSFRKKRKPLNIKNKSIRKRRRKRKRKIHFKKQKGGALTYIYIPVPTLFEAGGISFVLKKFNVKNKKMSEIIKVLENNYKSDELGENGEIKTKKTDNKELYAIIYQELLRQLESDNNSNPNYVLERLKKAMACGDGEELKCEEENVFRKYFEIPTTVQTTSTNINNPNKPPIPLSKPPLSRYAPPSKKLPPPPTTTPAAQAAAAATTTASTTASTTATTPTSTKSTTTTIPTTTTVPTTPPKTPPTSKDEDEAEGTGPAQITTEPGLLPGWHSTTTEDGDVYYYNQVSGASSWDKPAAEPATTAYNPFNPAASVRPVTPPMEEEEEEEDEEEMKKFLIAENTEATIKKSHFQNALIKKRVMDMPVLLSVNNDSRKESSINELKCQYLFKPRNIAATLKKMEDNNDTDKISKKKFLNVCKKQKACAKLQLDIINFFKPQIELYKNREKILNTTLYKHKVIIKKEKKEGEEEEEDEEEEDALESKHRLGEIHHWKSYGAEALSAREIRELEEEEIYENTYISLTKIRQGIETLCENIKHLDLTNNYAENIIKMFELVQKFYMENYVRLLEFVAYHAILISLLQLLSHSKEDGTYRISEKMKTTGKGSKPELRKWFILLIEKFNYGGSSKGGDGGTESREYVNTRKEDSRAERELIKSMRAFVKEQNKEGNRIFAVDTEFKAKAKEAALKQKEAIEYPKHPYSALALRRNPKERSGANYKIIVKSSHSGNSAQGGSFLPVGSHHVLSKLVVWLGDVIKDCSISVNYTNTEKKETLSNLKPCFEGITDVDDSIIKKFTKFIEDKMKKKDDGTTAHKIMSLHLIL